jgi:hypothetical protein
MDSRGVTALDRLDGWKATGVITEEQHAALSALVRRDRFSVFVELSALLYIGVLSLVGGLVWTFRDYVANLGDAVILAILGALMAASFSYCFLRGRPYSKDEIESPSLIFDYVLYFGCLVFAATLAFIETRFGIFRGWDTHLLIASLIFGGLAYRFDNRFVLSLAISTLAGYLGLKVEAFETIDTDVLRFYGLGYGAFLIGLGWFLYRQDVKRHFFDTYLHIGANVLLIAAISGVWQAEIPAISVAYLGVLLGLSAAAVYGGVRFHRFAFVAYGTLYGYFGLSFKLIDLFPSPTLALFYFAVTGIVVVVALVVLARRFGRDE